MPPSNGWSGNAEAGPSKLPVSKPKPKESTVSQASLFGLKSILSEHKDKFAKEGKGAVRGGGSRGEAVQKQLSRDKFSRPSPNLNKRLAQQKTRDFSALDRAQGRVSEDQRMAAMQKKAEMYERLKRGDLEGMDQRQLQEWTVDFEKKWQEQSDEEAGFSAHSSDVDESAAVPSGPSNGRGGKPRRASPDVDDFEDQYTKVEYVDEMGRTRTGTRKEAREAERERLRMQRGTGGAGEDMFEGPAMGVGEAHREVLQSNVIYGEQSFFPVYEPSQEDLLARLREAEGPSLTTHYDAMGENRARAAGAYQFSLDEDERRRQMDELKHAREETERKRKVAEQGMSQAEISRKRKLDERRAMIEAKRLKAYGGKEGLEKARKEANDKAADSFLEGLQKDLQTTEAETQTKAPPSDAQA